MIEYLIGGAIGALIAGVGSLVYTLLVTGGARTKAQAIIDTAELDAQAKIKDGEIQIKELELKRSAEFEKQMNATREKIHQRERALDKQQSQLDQKADGLAKQESFLEASQNRLKVKLEQATQREKDLLEIFEKQRKQLHQITGLSEEEATRRLLKLLEDELADEVGGLILQHEKKMEQVCEQKSREILLTTIQRFSAAHTADSTTSTVDIPSDEMKGRIIGREGRNIRAFEKETGIDVIIDDFIIADLLQ